MVEPPPSEGGEATITAMSALAAVGQYLSTNSAKSTFLRNTGLVVKASSSKPPHDQDMQAQNNVLSLHILIMRQFGRYCLNNQPSIMQERAFGTVSGQVLTHCSNS